MNYFDLILGITTFRNLSIYLPIIKYLSPKFNIGLYIFDISDKEKYKTAKTNRLFLDLCVEFGSKIVDKNNTIKSKIAILPQWPYSEKQIIDFRKKIVSLEYYVLLGLTTGNLNLEHLDNLRVDKYLVIDKDLYHYRLRVKKTDNKIKIDYGKIMEIGSPFKKYNIFHEMQIDYIIAIPTPLSLPESKDKFTFLKNVLKLINKIEKHDIIVLKPHNAIEKKDYIYNELIFNILGIKIFEFSHEIIRSLFENIIKIISKSKSKLFNLFKDFLYEILIVIYYYKILSKSIPLNELTPYYNFGIELFLPNVKKGLITGRSNTIWHALFNKIPVYNCVDERNIKIDKNKMNYYTMEYLNIPFCRGELIFDSKSFNIIRDEIRNHDFINYLNNRLNNI